MLLRCIQELVHGGSSQLVARTMDVQTAVSLTNGVVLENFSLGQMINKKKSQADNEKTEDL